MRRAVVPLCATTNESRVSFFDLVDEIETREQQLLHKRAELRHTLKTLYDSMVGRVTAEGANPAIYAYDTQNAHLAMPNHLADGLTQLTAL